MGRRSVYNHFLAVFNQCRCRQVAGSGAYVRRTVAGVTDIFFPGGSASP